MFKNLLLTTILLFVLFTASKADLPDTLWCKYTYPTQINCVKFTPDGIWLATGGSDGVVNSWDVATGAFIKEYSFTSQAVSDIDFSQNLIAICCSGFLRVFDFTNDSMLYNVGGKYARFSKDGNFLVTDIGQKTYGISIVDAHSWQTLKSFDIGTETSGFDISPDNKFVVRGKTWSDYSPNPDTLVSVDVYSIPDLKYETTIIKQNLLDINYLKFSDNNQYLAGALGSDGTNIWNTSDWSLFRNFSGEGPSCAFSNDNQYLILSKQFNMIGNWELKILNINNQIEVNSYTLNWLTNKYLNLNKGDCPLSISVSQDSKYICVGGGAGIYMLNAKWQPTSVPDNPIQIIQPIIFPNPTNGTATIQFNLLQPSLTNINIYDITSKLVTPIFSGLLQPGMQNFTWSVNNISSGNYFCKITTGSFTSTIQIIVNK